MSAPPHYADSRGHESAGRACTLRVCLGDLTVPTHCCDSIWSVVAISGDQRTTLLFERHASEYPVPDIASFRLLRFAESMRRKIQRRSAHPKTIVKHAASLCATRGRDSRGKSEVSAGWACAWFRRQIMLAFVSCAIRRPPPPTKLAQGIGRLPVKGRDKGRRPRVSFPRFRTGVVHTFHSQREY